MKITAYHPGAMALTGSPGSTSPAGGDLGGAFPGPTVVGIQGVPVSSSTPAEGEVLVLVGGVWTPAYPKQVIVSLTNQSGGSVAAGDVVIVDTAHDESFTTTTSAAVATAVGVVQATIASAAAGPVLIGGYATLVNVNASVTRGHFGATHTVAKQAADAGASRTTGTFCMFLKGGTTPSALVWDPNAAGGGGGTPGTPALTLSTTNGTGSASTYVATDATVAVFDATVPVTQALGDSAAAGSAGFAARRDHKHGMPAAAVTTSGLTQATARLLGRTTASTGAVEEITVGTGLSLSAGSLTATGSGATITTQDEGSTLSTTVTTLNFTGAGVTASGSGATTTVNVPGGGSSVTVQYPALKPATPTYDHAGASLDGAFSAHSSGGSFATGNVMTQALDGNFADMQYSQQMGGIYVSHSDTDFDFSVGQLSWRGLSTSNGGIPVMLGIAALNSSGTGVAVLVYNDSNVYLATITTWDYNTNSDSWSGKGVNANGSGYQGDWWFRLKRVGSTWTGYASQSGRAWDKTFATRADSITVDRLYIGLLYNTANLYSGRVLHDYFQVDV